MREQLLEQGKDPDDFPILREEASPIIFRDLAWVWEGFSTLSGSRQMGYMGPQPLPLYEILCYLDYRGIQDPDEREEFIYLVQSLDRRFVGEMIAKSKTSAPPPPPTGKRR